MRYSKVIAVGLLFSSLSIPQAFAQFELPDGILFSRKYKSTVIPYEGTRPNVSLANNTKKSILITGSYGLRAYGRLEGSERSYHLRQIDSESFPRASMISGSTIVMSPNGQFLAGIGAAVPYVNECYGKDLSDYDWSQDTITGFANLGNCTASNPTMNSINNNGIFVGGVDAWAYKPWVGTVSSAPSAIGLVDAFGDNHLGHASQINDSGFVMGRGYSQETNDQYRNWYYDLNSNDLTVRYLPAGLKSPRVTGLNNSGDAIIYEQDFSRQRTYFWSKTSGLQDITPVIPGCVSTPQPLLSRAINDAGTIVWSCSMSVAGADLAAVSFVQLERGQQPIDIRRLVGASLDWPLEVIAQNNRGDFVTIKPESFDGFWWSSEVEVRLHEKISPRLLQEPFDLAGPATADEIE
ncbi:MAG: hypothetical protein KDD64_01680 [Bdellovibrionales bacterium]|nr:hypothetical protein [Bdellovibrionales bacterium]